MPFTKILGKFCIPMSKIIDFQKILFFDLETVSEQKNWDQLSPRKQELWTHKSKYLLRKYDEDLSNEEISACYEEKAGIFAEFGKICCISMGYQVGDGTLRIKSIYNHEEEELLQEFAGILEKYFNDPQVHFLCGHNIKEFDVPYLCRRLMIHGKKLPEMINLSGKKPWETKHLLDTMELWKYGDIKHYTSLDLLAECFGIPTPKDDIKGNEVGKVYWQDNDLERIAVYCQKDVVTVAQILRKFNFLSEYAEEQIKYVD